MTGLQPSALHLVTVLVRNAPLAGAVWTPSVESMTALMILAFCHSPIQLACLFRVRTRTSRFVLYLRACSLMTNSKPHLARVAWPDVILLALIRAKSAPDVKRRGNLLPGSLSGLYSSLAQAIESAPLSLVLGTKLSHSKDLPRILEIRPSKGSCLSSQSFSSMPVSYTHLTLPTIYPV